MYVYLLMQHQILDYECRDCDEIVHHHHPIIPSGKTRFRQRTVCARESRRTSRMNRISSIFGTPRAGQHFSRAKKVEQNQKPQPTTITATTTAPNSVERPLADSSSSSSNQHCASCGSTSGSSSTCGRCHVTAYCSRTCQRQKKSREGSPTDLRPPAPPCQVPGWQQQQQQ